MKLKRNLIFLGVLIVVLCIGYYFAVKYEPPKEHTDIPKDNAVSLFEADADSVTKIDVKNPKDAFTLVKSDDKWTVEGRDYIELTSAVDSYIYYFARITASSIIDEASKDLSIYGLSEPQAEITVSAEGVDKSFSIGSLDPTGNYYYALESGKNTVYTVAKAAGDAYFRRLNSLRSMTVTDINIEEVRGIEIKSSDSVLNIVYSSVSDNSQETPWGITSPITACAQSKKVDEKLLTPVCKITANDIVEDNPTDFSKYKFDREVTIMLENSTQTLLIGSANGAYYIFREGAISVYSVGYDSIAFADITAQDIM